MDALTLSPPLLPILLLAVGCGAIVTGSILMTGTKKRALAIAVGLGVAFAVAGRTLV